jgi:FAD/FMN-containing dehydrogenase
MTAVLSGGEVIRTGGPALDPPGYDLRGILIGSEGTLGIVTEMVVRILPGPESVVTLLAVYDAVADAAQSVSDVIAAGIVPATLEMMDATVIRAVEASKPCGYPLDAAAVLIIEVDGPVAGLAQQAEQIRELCSKNHCREIRRARDAAERDLLWAGRRGAFGAIARLAPSYLVADCTVPRTRLPEALRRVASVAERHRLMLGNVFHAGDGNLHPLLLFDSRDPDQLRRVHEAGREIMEACVALGGTITGEHGVGMEKMDAMRLVFSEDDLDFQRRLRGAFDPSDLLNPGKIVPPAAGSQQPAAPAGGKLSPDQELTPADVAEACEIVRRAAADRLALLPQGNGTQVDFGNHSEGPVIPLRSTRLAAVIDHDPANQLVVVGAGISLDALQAFLAHHGQWLPIRPPLGGRSTAGGVAALAACGPERLRYGAPRDLLLGLKFVSGTGHPISAGGRVVKNVAGYDLTRLLVGSAGTLGFITELAFRVLSLPERCVALTATGPLAECAGAATELLQSKLEPAFVIARPEDPAVQAEGRGAWRLVAGFEGFEETVRFQATSYQSLLRRAGLDSHPARNYSPQQGICGESFDLLRQSPFLLRVDLPPDEVAAFVSAREDEFQGAAVLLDLGCGRIHASSGHLTADRWARLCTAAAEAGGHAIIEKAPDSFRRQHDVFGPPRSDWPLMRRVKSALDPQNIFAPGRLPGRR